MREPLNTDRELPVVPDREVAMARLASLVPAGLADAVWDEIIAPLYDARTLSIHWSHGRCRRCSVEHPALWGSSRSHRGPWPGHRPRCPKYVGPVEHRVVNGSMGLLGWNQSCSCGESYYGYDGDGNRQECPKAGETWRGPVAEVGR